MKAYCVFVLVSLTMIALALTFPAKKVAADTELGFVDFYAA